MVRHVNSVAASSIALFRCFMYLILLFFNNLHCMHCMYNVVAVIVVVEIKFNSIKKTPFNFNIHVQQSRHSTSKIAFIQK